MTFFKQNHEKFHVKKNTINLYVTRIIKQRKYTSDENVTKMRNADLNIKMSVQYTSTMVYVYTNNGFIIIIHPAFSIRDKLKIVSMKHVFWLTIVDHKQQKHFTIYEHYV